MKMKWWKAQCQECGVLIDQCLLLLPEGTPIACLCDWCAKELWKKFDEGKAENKVRARPMWESR
jgi:hypothetical protein